MHVRRWVTADLHEHAEAGFEQIGEAARHVLHVGTLWSVGVEDLLQELPQERPVGGLQRRRQHNNTPVNTPGTENTCTVCTHRHVSVTERGGENRIECVQNCRESFSSTTSACLHREGCGRDKVITGRTS